MLSFAPDEPPAWADTAEMATTSAESKALSKELKKRGFAFVGPTTMYALMEAIGIFDPHLVGCHRRGRRLTLESAHDRSGAQSPGVPLSHPARWVLHRVERTAWFTTRVTWRTPDGGSARWASRLARRRGRVELLDAAGEPSGFVEATPATARRLGRANLVAATAFTLGGTLFALGALLAQLGVGTLWDVDVVYLVGGVFFSVGGYVSVLQAANTPVDIDEHGCAGLDPLALVQLRAPADRVAQRRGAVRRDALLRRQPGGRVRRGPHPAPDQRLDLAPRHRRLRLLPGLGAPGPGRGRARPHLAGRQRPRAGGSSGSTSWARSSSSSPGSPPSPARPPPRRWTSGWSTGGRSPGAVCFAVGGVLQLFERPDSQRSD